MSKVTVFGGSGFLGSHVADALTEAGHKVTIYDINPSEYISTGQEMIVGDILDAEGVYKAVQDCDYVYNFAGIADLDDAINKPADTIMQNVVGLIVTFWIWRIAIESAKVLIEPDKSLTLGSPLVFMIVGGVLTTILSVFVIYGAYKDRLPFK